MSLGSLARAIILIKVLEIFCLLILLLNLFHFVFFLPFQFLKYRMLCELSCLHTTQRDSLNDRGQPFLIGPVWQILLFSSHHKGERNFELVLCCCCCLVWILKENDKIIIV